MTRRVVVGCLIMISVVSLGRVLAQDDTTPPSPEPQTLLEVTEEILPTLEVSVAPEIVATATSTPTDTLLSTAEVVAPDITTTVLPTQTQSVIVLPTLDVTALIVPSQTLAPSSTPALRAINGQALYPNRLLGQALIRVQAFAPDGTLLSTGYTDAKGLYALTGLADQVTRVQIDAPLYLAETLYLAPGINPQIIILRAGDLDGDACVGAADIDLLTLHYGQPFAGADLDGSGVVDVVDLTLLSSNYEDSCVAVLAPTATRSVVSDATEEAQATAEVTVEVSVVAPLPTEEVIATQEATAIVAPTEPPLPTATETPVPVATTEVLPEPTAEATAGL